MLSYTQPVHVGLVVSVVHVKLIVDDPRFVVCGLTFELLIRSSDIAREYVAVAGPPENHPGVGRKRFSPAVAKCVVFV